MVAARESAHDSLRNGLRVEVNVPERGRFVLAAVINIDRRLFRQSGTKIGERFDVLALPSAVPHEWSRNQEDASEGSPGRFVGQGSDQDRSADRGIIYEISDLQ